MSDKGHILVVDDESDIRYVLSVMLKSEGYKVTEAADGHECLERINDSKPDLVILDIMMPKMSGWEACDKIKEIDPKLPVAILTIKNGEGDEVNSFVSGANRHLTKPVKRKEVLRAVQDLLKRYKTS